MRHENPTLDRGSTDYDMQRLDACIFDEAEASIIMHATNNNGAIAESAAVD